MPKHMKISPSAESQAAPADTTVAQDAAQGDKGAESQAAPAGDSPAPARELPLVPEISDLPDAPAPDAGATLGSAETVLLPDPAEDDPILNIGAGADVPAEPQLDLTLSQAAPAGDAPEPVQTTQTFEPSDPAASEATPRRRGRRLLWLIPAAAIVLAGAGYVGGATYFADVFPPGTTIDGQDVSLQRHEDVASAKDSSHDSYALHASGNGLDITVSAADLGLTCDGTAYVEQATQDVSPWSWPLYLAQPLELSAEESVSFDETKLAALVTPAVEAVTQDTSVLENHGIVYSAEQGAFVLDERATAKQLNVAAVIEVMKQAVLAQQAEVAIGDECLEDSASLADTLNAANALLGAAGSTLSLNGTQVLDVPKDLVASWVRFGDDLSVSLDEDAVSEWVTANVGALDTAGKERTYTRPDGKQITVSGGSWGIVTNEAETTRVLLDALRGGTPQALDIPLRQSNGTVADANGRDWGNRYIDIDITEQHVRMYDDSGALIWESDCVTGDPTQDYDTPTGVNPINSNKAMNQTLKGLDYNGDGEPDYESYVTYWIPFVGNLVALHDADWRYYFGGSIYQGNGSHGCVNLPVGKAAELYELTRVGDCVVVHY